MVFEKVAEFLAEQLNVEVSQIKPESRIIEDLKADSLDLVELLMALEDEYNITVSEEDASKLSTVGDIVKIINKK